MVPPSGGEETVMVKLTGDPVQPLDLGVSVISALPVLVGVKAGMEVTPVRLFKPMEEPPVTSNTTPAGVPVRFMGEETIPLQSDLSPGLLTTGTGLTVMTILKTEPVHEPEVGVTV